MPNSDLNPTGGVQGTSPLYRFGTSVNTRSVVSQKIRILAPAYGANDALYQIGVLGEFTPNPGGRAVEPVRGIGFGDQVGELVPGVTDVPTASCTRQLLYLSTLWQATGYAGGVSGPIRSLKHHRWPFDVRQEIVFSTIADREFGAASGAGFTAGVGNLTYSGNLGGGNVEGTSGTHNILVTFYEGCWWTGFTISAFSKDSALVTESGDMSITDITDGSSVMGEFLASGNAPDIGQLGSRIYAGVF